MGTPSTYNLHFGNYAGLPVELAYIGFGLALAVITATGTTLWLCRRQRKGFDTRRLSAMWIVVVWDIPLALLLTAWLRFLGGPDKPLVATFWIGLALALAVAAVRPEIVSERTARKVLAIATGATGLAHVVAFRSFDPGNLAIDLVLVVSALLLWTQAWMSRSTHIRRTCLASTG